MNGFRGVRTYSHVVEKNENIQMFDHDMIQTCRKEKRLGWPKVRKKTSKTLGYETREETGQEKTIRNAGAAGNF